MIYSVIKQTRLVAMLDAIHDHALQACEGQPPTGADTAAKRTSKRDVVPRWRSHHSDAEQPRQPGEIR
jgi:hypothetical protein